MTKQTSFETESNTGRSAEIHPKDLEDALFIAADLVQTHGKVFLPAFLAIEALVDRHAAALDRVSQVLRARAARKFLPGGDI